MVKYLFPFQAMAYNAKILSSQEKAMDEYLRRQRASAEQHIHQMYHQPHQSYDGTNNGTNGTVRHRIATGKEDVRGTMVRLQDMQHQNGPKMPLTGMGPRLVPSSTPATPTGRRRNNNIVGSNSRNASPSR